MQAPPSSGSRSTSAVLCPKYAACAAPFSPAGPPPITTRSYSYWLMSKSFCAAGFQPVFIFARRHGPDARATKPPLHVNNRLRPCQLDSELSAGIFRDALQVPVDADPLLPGALGVVVADEDPPHAAPSPAGEDVLDAPVSPVHPAHRGRGADAFEPAVLREEVLPVEVRRVGATALLHQACLGGEA